MEKETGTEKERERATVPSASQVCRRPSPKILSSVINIFLQKKGKEKGKPFEIPFKKKPLEPLLPPSLLPL